MTFEFQGHVFKESIDHAQTQISISLLMGITFQIIIVRQNYTNSSSLFSKYKTTPKISSLEIYMYWFVNIYTVYV